MRKFAIALSTVLALSSCSTVSKHLAVNPSPQAEAAHKNEREGIEDLRQLVEESELEEAWAYVPRTEEWYDVGLEAKADGDTNSVELDVDKVKSVALHYSSFHSWHIHTQRDNIRFYQPFLDHLPKGYTRETLWDFINADAALPSADDLTFSIYFSCLFDQKKNRDDRYLIASHYGVTEFKPLFSGLAFLCQSTPEDDLPTQANIFGRLATHQFNQKMMIRKINYAVKNKTAAQLFENRYMRITFTPYSALKWGDSNF